MATASRDLALNVAPKTTNEPRNPVAWIIYFGVCLVIALLLVPLVQKETHPEFGTYWSSGAAAAQGLNPYAVYPETFVAYWGPFGGPKTNFELNLNPPLMLPLFQAMSHLSMARFATAWTVVSFFLFASTVGLLLWRFPAMQSRQLLWLLLACPVFDTFDNGTIYFLLFFLSAVACVDRNHGWASAVAIGLLVAIKPTFIFWPIFLFLAGHGRLAWRSARVIIIASLLPLIVYRPLVYRQWLGAITNDPHWIPPVNIAIPAYFARFGMHTLGLIVATLVAGYIGWQLWKSRPDIETVSGIALCCSILCAPLAWNDYALFLAPWLVSRGWGKLSTAAALLLMLPTAIALSFHAQGLPVVYFVGVSLILIKLISRHRKSARFPMLDCPRMI
jgi:hypothetical protein